MLESFATEHDDLGDNIEELQDGVSTHRMLEQLKLTNERNGSTRLPEPLRAHSLRLCVPAAASAADGRAFGLPSNRGASQSCASSCCSPLALARSPSAQQWAVFSE